MKYIRWECSPTYDVRWHKSDVKFETYKEAQDFIREKVYPGNEYRHLILLEEEHPLDSNAGLSWEEITKEEELVFWERSNEGENTTSYSDWSSFEDFKRWLNSSKIAKETCNRYRFGFFPKSLGKPQYNDPRWKTWQELCGVEEKKEETSIDRSLNKLTQIKGETKMSAARTLFNVAVVLHSTPKQDGQGNDITPDSTVLLQPTAIIAADHAHAEKIALTKCKLDGVDLKLVQLVVKGF